MRDWFELDPYADIEASWRSPRKAKEEKPMLIDQKLAIITVQEGEDIIRQMISAAEDLCRTIESDMLLRRILKETEADLSAMEAEIVAEANIAAIGKGGPLAGIATTSKAYAYALENLLSSHPQTTQIRQTIRRLQVQVDNASIAVQQAQVRFAAIKHAADLKAAILRAIAL